QDGVRRAAAAARWDLGRRPLCGRGARLRRCLSVAARTVLLLTVVSAAALPAAVAEEGLRPFAVVGDAIPQPLTGAKGDAARGRAIVASRGLGSACCATRGPFPRSTAGRAQ